MAAIHGAYTAMITPMNADGSVDYDGFAKNVQFQLDQGILHFYKDTYCLTTS